MIYVVSLGVERGDLTLGGKKTLLQADEVLVRTAAIPSAQTLDDEHIPYQTLDFLYEKSRNYDTLAKNIAAEVRRRAKGKTVCYCVDGSFEEDAAARLLLAGKGAEGVGGKSKAAHFAGLCGLGEYTAVSAFSVAEKRLALPLVVYDITEDNISDVKLFLSEKFGDEAPAVFVCGRECRSIPLFEADRQADYSFAGLVLEAQPLLEKKRFDFDDLLAIMRRLRAPDGCPWDKAQTHESLRINCIEEAYELVDAIDLLDPDKICEEAGDVLMQSVFHALIEEEAGNFTVTDMLTGLCEKLITRHTHVFGQDKAAGADGALSVWEKNKMSEKRQTTYSDAVNDVPACFPALLRAQKIAKRVEKGGWDAPSFEQFEANFAEEYGELKKAFADGKKEEIESELGDVLMSTVWLGRAVGADCETALLDTVKKIQKRYNAYENLVRADGKDPTKLSEEERNEYYRMGKEE